MAAPTVSAVSPNSGPLMGGTPITITGTGFVVGATTVAINGVAALGVNVISSTSIVCITPPNPTPGVYNVIVTTSGGSSSINAGDQFTYSGVPVVTSVSPARGITAGGQNVTINGYNFQNTTVVYFGTVPVFSGATSGSSQAANTVPGGTGYPWGSGFTINQTGTQIYAVAPPALTARQVDVTVVSPYGTSTTSSADQFTYQTAGYFNTVADVANYASNNLIRKTLNYSDVIPWINDCMQVELMADACLFNNWTIPTAQYNVAYAVPADFLRVYAVYDSNGDDFYDYECDSAFMWFDYGGSLYTVRYYQLPPIVSSMTGTDPLPCHPLIANALPYYLAYRFASADFPNDKDTSQRYSEFRGKVQLALDQMQKRFNRQIKVSSFR